MSATSQALRHLEKIGLGLTPFSLVAPRTSVEFVCRAPCRKWPDLAEAIHDLLALQ